MITEDLWNTRYGRTGFLEIARIPVAVVQDIASALGSLGANRNCIRCGCVVGTTLCEYGDCMRVSLGGWPCRSS